MSKKTRKKPWNKRGDLIQSMIDEVIAWNPDGPTAISGYDLKVFTVHNVSRGTKSIDPVKEVFYEVPLKNLGLLRNYLLKKSGRPLGNTIKGKLPLELVQKAIDTHPDKPKPKPKPK